jgi:hypothetical protein
MLNLRKDSNCLYYLVDQWGGPLWEPYLLFDISDNCLPSNWYVQICDKKGPGDLFYLSGFYELCNDDDYHDLLMDRDEGAMDIYFKRKIEFENNANSI